MSQVRSMDKAVSKASSTECGNCGAGIDPNSQFCAGCGQPLWQKCACGGMALLTQAFCNGCGANLDEKLETRLQAFERLFARCHELRSSGKYSDAIRLADTALNPTDYRFQHVADQAERLIAQLREEQENWNAELVKVEKRVERYLPADRFADIVRILSRIPEGVLTSELAEILDNCKTKSSTTEQCRAELNDALAAKKYDQALLCLAQLAELNPTEAKYPKQITRLVHKVLQKADKYRQQWRFPRAVELLHSVPSSYQDTKFLNLLQECEEAIYLRKILAKSTYLNPLLPGVLDKLEKMTQGDPAITKLRKRLSESRLKVAKLKSEIWPEWMKAEKGFLGIPIIPSRVPNAFPGAKPECLTRKGGQFFVAIGLAAQAAVRPMPKGEFAKESKSKGVLGFLSGKKSKATECGWGIDIGDSSIKAVRLRYAGDEAKPQIEFATWIRLNTQPGSIRKVEKEAIEAGIEKLLSEVTIGEDRVIVNVSGSDLVSRYILLPPTADPKKFDEFVMQDAKANIPINMDLLVTAHHVSDPGKDEFAGRSALLVAARKQEIDFRKALLENAGLKVDGFLPESFALWNALQTMDRVDPRALAVPSATEDDLEPGKSVADMLIDVGLQRSNIVIAHANGIWHRTLDWGMENFNAALAKSMQLTQVEADAMRREPLRASCVQIPLDAMQAAVAAPKRELERSTYAAREAIGELRFRRVILVGGGAYQPFLSSWLNGCDF